MLRKLISAMLVAVAVCAAAKNPYKQYTANLPFALPEFKAPKIPGRRVVLTDFDADSTGTKLCTDAFAKAIKTLGLQGGGHLIVPRGVWLTGVAHRSYCAEVKYRFSSGKRGCGTFCSR